MVSDNALTWKALTASSLLHAQKKSGRRLGQKKSRRGCITCKIRRIKCDETHPACNRCIRTGRKCDGYVLPTVGSAKSASLTSQLSPGLTLEAKDARSFDYFLTWVAPRLAGSLDKDFWCGQVLQLAHAEPLILDALLSISILYEHPQFMKTFRVKPVSKDAAITAKPAIRSKYGISLATVLQQNLPDDCEDPDLAEHEIHPGIRPRPIDQYHAEALQRYNRSIAAFKVKMESGNATPMLAILTCALFICIEIIRDDVYAALGLFTKGKQLLKNNSINPGAKEEKLYTNIKLMFGRLGVLAVVFGHPEPLEVPDEFYSASKQLVFSSLADARTAMFALMAGSHEFIREAAIYKASLGFTLSDNAEVFDTSYVHDDLMIETSQAVLPATFHVRPNYKISTENERIQPVKFKGSQQQSTSRIIPIGMHAIVSTDVPERLIAQQDELERRLGQWYDAFQWIKGEDEEASSLLLVHYHISFVWQTTRLSPLQSVFDQYTYHFKEILRLAEVYINVKSTQTPTWTSEVGVIPALYFVATKCRIPSLRRKALALLMRAPEKECMWGARSCAEIAARLVLVEEGDMAKKGHHNSSTRGIPDDSVLPSEEKRIHTIEISRNLALGRHDLRVSRYVVDSCGKRKRIIEVYPI